MKGKKIGLFGGTFDPIHNGHLNLAFELMEKKHLDKIWFIPAQINPFKTDLPPIPIEHRLEMLKIAAANIPEFEIKDLEKFLPPPSYTINTLHAFISEEALSATPNQFFLIMGEDTIPKFLHWHLPEEIVKLVPLLIGSRSGAHHYDLNIFTQPIREAIQKGIIPTRLVDISGTEIRKRLSKGLYCGHLLPNDVLKYIFHNKVYQKD